MRTLLGTVAHVCKEVVLKLDVCVQEYVIENGDTLAGLITQGQARCASQIYRSTSLVRKLP